MVFNKKNTKLIKVTDRGMIVTSRGVVRGPITVPYLETYDAILLMISRYNNNVFEVLKNGAEIQLNINNFNKDNNAPKEVIPTVEKRQSEPNRELNPTQAINAGMSRKERKRLEYERQQAEAIAQRKAAQDASAQQNENKEEQTNVTVGSSDTNEMDHDVNPVILKVDEVSGDKTADMKETSSTNDKA